MDSKVSVSINSEEYSKTIESDFVAGIALNKMEDGRYAIQELQVGNLSDKGTVSAIVCLRRISDRLIESIGLPRDAVENFISNAVSEVVSGEVKATSNESHSDGNSPKVQDGFGSFGTGNLIELTSENLPELLELLITLFGGQDGSGGIKH